MNKLYFFGLLLLLTVAACKKDKTCPPAISSDDCERFENRIYPKFDITNDPDAWYETDIEGSLSTLGTGFESEGFVYYGNMVTRFRTSDPELPPGTPKVYDLLQMRFSLYKPSENYLNKPIGIVEFYSPAFDADTVNDLSALTKSLLSPGIKKIEDGTGIEGSGWFIGLNLFDAVNKVGETNLPGAPMFTNRAQKEVPENYFEITRSEAKDMGSFVRFTIWCNFHAELYRRIWDQATGNSSGSYFGPLQNGKAKLYVDVNK